MVKIYINLNTVSEKDPKSKREMVKSLYMLEILEVQRSTTQT